MKEIKKEVIIVGGGPAGSFTALYLISRCPELAEDIILLEAKHRGRDKVCAGGVSGRVIKGALRDLGVDLSTLDGRDVDGLVVKFQVKEYTAMCPNLARVIKRDKLDAYLLDCVMERGVTVLTDTPVTHIERSPRGVIVKTEEEVFEGRILVGADGVNGIIKRTFNLEHDGHKEYSYLTELLDVEVPSKLMLDYTPILFGVPGYAWVFPQEKGANAGITGGSAENMEYVKQVFLRMMERNLGKKLNKDELEFKVWPERFFSFSVPSHLERIIFVGDNLGVVPMTGEGIGICLNSAKAASEEILLALGNCNYSFKGYPRRLLTSDFIPTWFMEHVFLKWKTPFLFKLFFLLTMNLNRPEGKTFLDEYCKIFAGKVAAQSLASWGSLLKILPSRKLLSREARVFTDRMSRYRYEKL